MISANLRELFRAAVLVGLLSMAAACHSADGPTRPLGVPADAFWLGGADGGVFVKLDRRGTRPVLYEGAIYQLTGEVWYQGQFRLEPADGAPVDPKDASAFSGWDGGRLLMTDGRALVAFKP